MDLRALLGVHRMKQEADKLVDRGAAIHQLQYDDLVNDPNGSLTAICDFLDIPFDPKMNTLEGADRSAIYNGDHHSMVKSTTIVSNRERPEVLSPEFKAKVERYVAYWRKQYNGQWPVNAVVTEGTKPASTPERLRDSIRLNLLRAADSVVPFAYTMVPTPLWQKYRQVKSRYQQVALDSHSGKAVE